MRREGADEITIIKQIAQEDTDPDTKWTHTNQDKQRYEQEIGEIVKTATTATTRPTTATDRPRPRPRE
jgi:hypothetical protein